MERFLPLRLPPGLYHNGTKYQAKGRWYSANLVRWFNGIMGPVGGWSRLQNSSHVDLKAADTPRVALGFRDNGAIARLAIGGPKKLYMYGNGALTDITPAGITTGSTDGTFSSTNYGSGNYGSGTYGASIPVLIAPDTWQLDTFGELLVGVLTSDGKIYISSPVGTQATQVSGSPTGCLGVVVTPERFLVALGAGGDPRSVQWAAQQTTTTWTPAASNTAGSFPLSSRGRLMAGRRARGQTLLWTDVDMYAMSYIGGTLVYSFQQVGDNCGLIGPNAVTNFGDVFFWMSYNKFFMYNGTVQEIPCDVWDYVFPRLNAVQAAKIVAFPVSQFNEIWWFYPSSNQSGTENDSYVKYSTEGHWDFGTLARGAGIDRGTFSTPVMCDPSGYLYQHETGNVTDTQVPFAESGPIELGNGDRLMVLSRLLPDEQTLGDTKTTVYAAINPTDAETVLGPFTSTAPTTLRATGRQLRLRIDQVNATSWRYGNPRLGVKPGSAR